MASTDDINTTLQDLVRQLALLNDNIGTVFPLTTIFASATFDPPNIAGGAQASTTVACPGASLGQFATANFSLDLQLIELSAYVSAADVVTVLFKNGTAGAIDLASGNLSVRVFN